MFELPGVELEVAAVLEALVVLALVTGWTAALTELITLVLLLFFFIVVNDGLN